MVFSDDKIKEIITKGKEIGTGTQGKVIYYENILYKIYLPFLRGYKKELLDICTSDINSKFGKSCLEYEQSLEQINLILKYLEYYKEVQSNIKRTNLPQEPILQYSEKYNMLIPLGFILKYEKGKELEQCSLNKKELFYVLREILESVKELCDNGIYFKDLHGGNVLYDGNDIHLIDLDPNEYITIKKDLSYEVYPNFSYLIGSIIRKNVLRDYTCRESLYTYEDTLNYIKRLEHRI